jgi:hypothetical protein
MKRMCIILCAASILGVIVTPTAAYQNLGDLMTEKGVEWIVGKWESTGPGFVPTMHMEWDLGKHMIRIHMTQPPNMQYLMMMIFDPSLKEINGMGVDTMGAAYKLVWRPEGTALVQRCIRIDEKGNTSENEFVFTKVDSSTMKMDIHAIEEGDRRASKPSTTIMYKRESKEASHQEE